LEDFFHDWFLWFDFGRKDRKKMAVFLQSINYIHNVQSKSEIVKKKVKKIPRSSREAESAGFR